MKFNWNGMGAIYRFEMARTGRTLLQSIVSPVISTTLYFVVFGAAMGSHMGGIDVLLRRLGEAGIDFKDLQTRQSSLEDIFVSLVEERA